MQNLWTHLKEKISKGAHGASAVYLAVFTCLLTYFFYNVINMSYFYYYWNIHPRDILDFIDCSWHTKIVDVLLIFMLIAMASWLIHISESNYSHARFVHSYNRRLKSTYFPLHYLTFHLRHNMVILYCFGVYQFIYVYKIILKYGVVYEAQYLYSLTLIFYLVGLAGLMFYKKYYDRRYTRKGQLPYDIRLYLLQLHVGFLIIVVLMLIAFIDSAYNQEETYYPALWGQFYLIIALFRPLPRRSDADYEGRGRYYFFFRCLVLTAISCQFEYNFMNRNLRAHCLGAGAEAWITLRQAGPNPETKKIAIVLHTPKHFYYLDLHSTNRSGMKFYKRIRTKDIIQIEYRQPTPPAILKGLT